MVPRAAIAMWLCAVACAACADRAVPHHPTTAALYRDLERLVTLTEAAGWDIDRVEIDQTLPDALLSVCRVPEARRAELLAWLDARVAAQGGDVRAVYVARGRSLDRVRDLLVATRVRMLLRAAMAAAPADCPFWIEPSDRFRGRQISDDRWQLSFGGGGKGIVSHRAGTVDLQFGGAGRVLFGRAIGSRYTLLAGLEVGASASFPKDDMDERGNLVLGLDVVVPAVVRYRLVNTYWEAEVGYLEHVTENRLDGVPGVHVGLAIGGRAARRRWLLPGAAFGIAYERTFPSAGQDDPIDLVKLGFRAAVDIDW
ncbi:MAG: hypothetical protein D6689_15940 [Deltaproteobacteria bacterium]|nr:MAG: hypothetical protein D6689_15940 [Deltaproteobacteria bacterium]